MSRYLKVICGCFSVCNVESMNWTSVNNDIPMFGFEGETHDGKVVNVYDGDTVKIVMKMFGKFYRFNWDTSFMFKYFLNHITLNC